MKLKVILFVLTLGFIIAMVDPFTSTEVKNFAKENHISVRDIKERAKILNMSPDELVSHMTSLETISNGIDTYLDENYPDY